MSSNLSRVSLALLVTLTVTLELVRANDYLLFIEENKEFTPEINYIADLIEGLPNEDPTAIMDFVNKKADSVKELIHDPKSGQNDYDPKRLTNLYRYLSDLSVLEPLKEPCNSPECQPACSYWAQELIFATLNVRFGGLESFAKDYSAGSTPTKDRKLFNFFKHFIGQHVDICKETLSSRFWQKFTDENKKAEIEFDQIVSKEDAKDDKLYKSATAFSLLDPQIDFADMISVLKFSASDASDERGKDKMLIELMRKSCMKLTFGLSSMFESYNIARTLGQQVDVSNGPHQSDLKFRKLNEYFRICNQLTSPKTRVQVEENMHNGLSIKGRLSAAASKLHFKI